MQNTSVQTVKTSPADSTTTKKAASSQSRSGTDQAEYVDPFMQIIMNMIAQMEQSSPAASQTQSVVVTDVSPLLSLLQTRLGTSGAADAQDETGLSAQDGPQSFLQLMALMNLQTQQNTLLGTDSSAALGTASTDLQGLSIPVLQMTQLLSDYPELAKSGNVTQLLSQLTNFSKMLQSDSTGASLASLSGTDAIDTTGLGILKAVSADSGSSAADLLTAQSNFSDVISKVKQAILTSTADSDDTKSKQVDVDALQAQLDGNKISRPSEISFKNTQQTQAAPVLDQLTTGIKENLALGKSEFTITLKPESLGEITVKLVEQAGKQTLTITAASAETVKLINSDLNALREAVAPMNVHVNEAVTQSSASSQSGLQQYDLSGQQFAGQQFAGQQSFMRFAGASSNGNADENYETAAAQTVEIVGVRLPTSVRLDAYV